MVSATTIRMHSRLPGNRLQLRSSPLAIVMTCRVQPEVSSDRLPWEPGAAIAALSSGESKRPQRCCLQPLATATVPSDSTRARFELIGRTPMAAGAGIGD